jgi:tetratricopeptide (TPR) repeat protein
MAQSREQSGEPQAALRGYVDAIALDPSHEPSYLALGALRERLGDVSEAERTFAVGAAHVPQSTRLFIELARVHYSLGRRDLATQEILRVAPRDPTALRALAQWNEAARDFPQALASWRAALAFARENGDAGLAHDARDGVRALVFFLGELDPATHPAVLSADRRTLAKWATR